MCWCPMVLPLLRAYAAVDARNQELQLREDRIVLKETELTSLEQSTRASLKTAQEKVSCLFATPADMSVNSCPSCE